MATTVDISKVARLPLRQCSCLANYHQLDYPAFFVVAPSFVLLASCDVPLEPSESMNSVSTLGTLPQYEYIVMAWLKVLCGFVTVSSVGGEF